MKLLLVIRYRENLIEKLEEILYMIYSSLFSSTIYVTFCLAVYNFCNSSIYS